MTRKSKRTILVSSVLVVATTMLGLYLLGYLWPKASLVVRTTSNSSVLCFRSSSGTLLVLVNNEIRGTDAYLLFSNGTLGCTNLPRHLPFVAWMHGEAFVLVRSDIDKTGWNPHVTRTEGGWSFRDRFGDTVSLGG